MTAQWQQKSDCHAIWKMKAMYVIRAKSNKQNCLENF